MSTATRIYASYSHHSAPMGVEYIPPGGDVPKDSRSVTVLRAHNGQGHFLLLDERSEEQLDAIDLMTSLFRAERFKEITDELREMALFGPNGKPKG